MPRITIAQREWVTIFFWPSEGFKPPIISTLSMVLALNRTVSADDITAQSRAASTIPPINGEKTSIITVGKACSGEIPGKRAAAPMPIRVIARATGISRNAVHSVAVLAVLSSLAQKMREYMSGPTT